MRLYHGTNRIVQHPKFGVGRPYNDFGLGFYCTDSEALAADWAASPDSNGFISVYAFDDAGLRIIDLCSSQYTIMHWLSLLINYREFDAGSIILHQAREYISRNFPVDYQSSDCIAGYRADNVNFTLAQLFLNDKLSLQDLRRYLTYNSMGKQFVLKSNRAFDRISYVGYITSSSDIHPARTAREISILSKALKSEKKSDMYISQMISEDIRAYDPRLQ